MYRILLGGSNTLKVGDYEVWWEKKVKEMIVASSVNAFASWPAQDCERP